MTITGSHRRAPHAMQSQTQASQQQAGAPGAMTALAGSQIGGFAPRAMSSAPAVAMKMPR